MGGSRVDRIAAIDGPTRRMPAKKSRTGVTVETSAIAASQPQPAPAKPVSNEPVATPAAPNVTAAPVVTSADSGSGGTCTVT